MGLLSGPATVTRFSVERKPADPAFEQAAFRELAPGGEVRQRSGFVPFEPDAPYQVGQHRWAFRVRIDTLRPDPTGVAERLKQLVKTERELTGKQYINAKTRRRLRHLAEEELIVKAAPRTRVVECVIDAGMLYVGSSSSGPLSAVLDLLRAIDVAVELKAPWLDSGEPDVVSAVIEPRAPGHAVLGCRFLKALIGDSDVTIEPEAGSVSLQTAEARVTLRGAVLPDLQRYLQGDAELLAAKLVSGEATFRFEAMPFRVAGARVETERHDAWTEQLDARLEKLVALYDLLDRKYASLRESLHASD
jgi:hypothetical protein